MGKLLKSFREGIIERGEAGAVKRARRREKMTEVKQRHKEIFAAEFAKVSDEQIKRKARMEATHQFRTTAEKTQDIMQAFGSLGGQPKKKKKLTESERIKMEVRRQLGTKGSGMSESEKIKREVRRQTGAKKSKNKSKKKQRDPFDLNLDVGFDF